MALAQLMQQASGVALPTLRLQCNSGIEEVMESKCLTSTGERLLDGWLGLTPGHRPMLSPDLIRRWQAQAGKKLELGSRQPDALDCQLCSDILV